MYPVMLNLKDRRCLVVGGGGVALRKVEGLLVDRARVTLISPEVIDAIGALAQRGKIAYEQRDYRSGEAGEFELVFATTDDREVNRQVYEDARAAGVWINVADDPELCTFQLPARVQRGALQLAVASAGEAPFVVRRMRQVLERRLGPEWAEWAEAAARFRQQVRARDLARADQERLFDTFFDATVDPRRLIARVPTVEETDSWLSLVLELDDPAEASPKPRQQRGEGRAKASEPSTAKPGLVSLVGAGPGDPGLLTVRGRQRLLAADAVVCDRLAMTALPCELTNDVELHWVGKEAGRHPIPQEEINALLVRLAREGKRVVRLKGGDPYIFGRGGEEAEVLIEAGIPFEVVPCVTAAVAVPAYAGIPVTYRNEAVRLTLVTAHESKKAGGPQVRWDLLAGDRHATLLGYMGVTSLPKVVDSLLEHGMDPATPAAMIERGTTSRQRVARSSLAQLPRAVERAGLKPPALFAIGPAVRHAERLDWFGARPLLGQRVLVPAPAGSLHEALELAGAEVVEAPLPLTEAARIVIGALPLTGCVLVTVAQVDGLDEERDAPGWSRGVVAWCLDRAAADRARELGWQRVELVDGEREALVDALIRQLRS
jgi:uroporphyrin-III C-methyltransferase/precorrin-2 dehydrogenase/sirohydrochlorin ferrochelatase